MHNPGRRRFIKTLAIGVGASPLLPIYAAIPWRFFSADQAALVDALCEQIIPGDEDPGAHDARVVRFIDRQLVGPYRMHQDAYRHGLIGVEITCQKLFSLSYLKITWNQQTEILRLLESGKVPEAAWSKPSPRVFFNLLRDHTLQGFYGSPRHGGNRNYASYKMLGLDYPQIIGQNRYRS